MIEFTGHFLVFTAVTIVFLMVPLLIGRLVRPKLPTPEKIAVYECGEPTIGSSYIQFDLRFYVVALLFIVFDVEVAFFFPWASVFGTAAQLTDSRISDEARVQISQKLLSQPEPSAAATLSAESAQQLAQFALLDILVFFSVLLVGFAYLWKRGDLDWVRAVAEESRRAALQPHSAAPPPAELAATSR